MALNYAEQWSPELLEILMQGTLSKGEDLNTIKEALGLLFSEKDLTAICRYKKDGKKLSAKSLMLIVNTAIELVTGEDEGEQ